MTYFLCRTVIMKYIVKYYTTTIIFYYNTTVKSKNRFDNDLYFKHLQIEI
jgi:hypothetical protein